MQKGNTVFNINGQTYPYTTVTNALAAHFRDVDITGAFDIVCWDPIHVVISGDYVKNIGFNAQEVSALSGRPVGYMQDYAWKAGLLVGYPAPRKFLQWNVFAYYKYVGTDSVVDAFDDSDFHLGGTNAQGWIVGAELGLMKNVWLTARWMTADQISPFQNSNGPFSVDVFQFDTNASF
ncbi:MAG TPA: putative porin, partial [Syntrophobacteraceae bacterium]|nr:putative porin [Syntrophobacteraceae bacterium]